MPSNLRSTAIIIDDSSVAPTPGPEEDIAPKAKRGKAPSTVTDRKDLAYAFLSCARLVEDVSYPLSAARRIHIQSTLDSLVAAIEADKTALSGLIEPDPYLNITQRTPKRRQVPDSDTSDFAPTSKKRSTKKPTTTTPHARRTRASSPNLDDTESLEFSTSFTTETPTTNRRAAKATKGSAKATRTPKTPTNKNRVTKPAPTPRTARRAELGLDRSSAPPTSEEDIIPAVNSDENRSPITFYRPTRRPATVKKSTTTRTPRTHKKKGKVATPELESGTSADENHFGFGGFRKVSKRGRENAVLMEGDYRKGERAWLGGFVKEQVLGLEELERKIEGEGLVR
ncbi:hypothetical protein BJ508DRAFT_77802 [Ascobolus immersus RN42]|uniref:Uncharacterized protein n=1 Tax=Ascobolus immersus RN42 TaxID=1160509 RepID=A0A3N4IFX4_ASCIM|nr:hypothetical protein BJ508DRAFT_77802 [Ascobolus immersus RN42]